MPHQLQTVSRNVTNLRTRFRIVLLLTVCVAATLLPGAQDEETKRWSDVLTPEIVRTEVMRIKASMKDSLISVSKYNSSCKRKIPEDMATLAALANILAEEPMDVLCGKALEVRAGAADVQSKAGGLGETPYNATKKAWDQLDALLAAPVQPDAKPGESAAFAQLVKRASVMRRMENAFSTMKSKIRSAESLQAEKASAEHDAAMLITISRIVATKGYDSADDAEYQAYARALQKAGREIHSAVKAGDYTAFSDALSRANKTCGECHTNFKP